MTEATPGRNEALLYDAGSRSWLWFQDPLRVLVAERPEEIPSLLDALDVAVTEERKFAAGFLAYEAAPALDTALVTRPPGEFPLAWFAVYDEPICVPWPPRRTAREAQAMSWRPSLSAEEYGAALGRIRAYIRDGDTYQINYTYRLTAACRRDPFVLWTSWMEAQGAGYGAYLDIGRWAICSMSPELFLERCDGRVISRPMKGTASRGLTPIEDEDQAITLRRSTKDRAENLMIVDMVRNDLGRIAAVGSVSVPELYRIERYPTVWQMTSTIEAESGAGLLDTLRATFPAASITGAPKARAMEIIAELETRPRNIYTGTIGFLRPDGRDQWNVAIRTVLVDRERELAEYGTGGGIVWDSSPEKEYQETQTKARILSHARPEFSLLETMLWSPDEGLFLLDRHLRRAADSAHYFGFCLDPAALKTRLADFVEGLGPVVHRVRLLVGRDGSASLEAKPLPSPNRGRRLSVCLARTPIDRTNAFLYHKTTQREVYDNALAAHAGFDDVILWNQHGEITESCLANVVVELDGALYTPPVHCGLLAGTYRAWLLDEDRIKERVILVSDLRRCTRVTLVNSVRRERDVELDLSLAPVHRSEHAVE